MPTQTQRAEIFKNLHKKGDPVVIYNVWDAGSAKAVGSVGAKAIATGGHGVANAFGYEDGEQIPLELALSNAARITASVEQPFSMDIDTGYGESTTELQATIKGVIEAGVIGINIEDKLVGTTTLRATSQQADRIAIIRQVVTDAGIPLFINARTDLFTTTNLKDHNAELVSAAVERAIAYKAAGADGFFAPLLSDIDLIRQLCKASPLPVNILWLDGSPSPQDLATAGVARISYGPGPYLKMIEWLKTNASNALASPKG